ncbi:hypothetical protein Droror1_Dr00020808 [Drosera rotundifolia]
MVESTKKYISADELKTHNKKGDVWISIQGKTYDVSTWVDSHPGGEYPLLVLAGQDVTDTFIAFHPGSAWHELDKFFTGFHLEDYKVSPVSRDYRNLVSQFAKMGLFEAKAHDIFVLAWVIMFLFALSVHGVIFVDGFWVHASCGGLIGLMWIQCGWIFHDSSHYVAIISPTYNRLALLLFSNCLSGVSNAWWKWNHNAHHIACNSLEFDPDIQHMPVFVVSTEFFESLTSRFYDSKMTFDRVSRFLVSYQHWTLYPVLCFARTFLWAMSIIMLFSKRKVPNRGVEILCVLIFWVWYPLLVSRLPNWGERVAFVLANFVVVGILQVQFVLNHFSSSVYHGAPNGNDFFEKQTSGSLDILCPSWMDWFHGGLQFQIEHHLFPRLPKNQLRKISPFVKQLCAAHNLPYNCVSFFKANAMLVQTLRAAALKARNITNPVPRNLVWEAVNIQG